MALLQSGVCCSPFGREGMDTSDGWCNAPPIFSFSSRRKRENGPCTVQKRKRRNGDDTGARLNDRRSRNDFPRAIGLSGGLSFTEWTSSSFRCRSSGGRGWMSAFFRDCPFIGRTSRRGRRPRRSVPPGTSMLSIARPPWPTLLSVDHLVGADLCVRPLPGPAFLPIEPQLRSNPKYRVPWKVRLPWSPSASMPYSAPLTLNSIRSPLSTWKVA